MPTTLFQMNSVNILNRTVKINFTSSRYYLYAVQHFLRVPKSLSLRLDLLPNMAFLIAMKSAELDIQDFTCL